MDIQVDKRDKAYRRRFPGSRGMRLKMMISLILLLGVWVLFRLHAPFALRGQEWVRSTLTQELAFQSVSAWYGHTFSGAPSFIPSLHSPSGENATKANAAGQKSFFMPVFGKVIVPYSSKHHAITLQTQANAFVCAIETGRVLYAGVKPETGYTVIIQHAGGYQSTYGMLQPNSWKKDDWITLGEVVGKATIPKGQTKGNVVLALMKDAEYINPTDVIAFE